MDFNQPTSPEKHLQTPIKAVCLENVFLTVQYWKASPPLSSSASSSSIHLSLIFSTYPHSVFIHISVPPLDPHALTCVLLVPVGSPDPLNTYFLLIHLLISSSNQNALPLDASLTPNAYLSFIYLPTYLCLLLSLSSHIYPIGFFSGCNDYPNT